MKKSVVRRALVASLVGALAIGGALLAPQAASASFGQYTYTGLFRVGNTVSVSFDFSGISPAPTESISWWDQDVNAQIGTGDSLTIPASTVTHKIYAKDTLSGGFSGTGTAGAITVSPGTVSAAGVSISGTGVEGQTLHAAISALSPSIAPVSYLWARDGVAIAGATAADYVLLTADVGHAITVSVHIGGDGFSNTLDLVSPATALIAALTVTTPVTTPLTTPVTTSTVVALLTLKSAAPKITGTAKVGKTLKVAVGSWKPAPKFAYQWLANGKKISKATKATLKLTKSLKGKNISVSITATKTGYTSAIKTSKATAKVK